MGDQEPIAVIGMSFKFPGGAETSEDFWKLLAEKRNVAKEVPADRFNIDAFWHPDSTKQNIINTREAHFLASDPRGFDAGFFSMAPHEVLSMDPQHRGLLESTYHAFESAGLPMHVVAGSKTSVHVGCFTSDFASIQSRDMQNMPKYNSLGTAGSMLANRISWFYDLRGESMFIDTACSSSMVAMALGCKGLTTGEADIAVVGGANLILVPEFFISLSNMKMLSPSGRCHSFDVKGDGYGRGEGFATLVLKPLSKAIADGNPIRALVRSIGMNQDGYTSSGITQPSKDMQVQLIHDTYRKAGIDMKHTRFFEAHGTGTPVGDPIEARAIGEAFFHSRSKTDPIYIGAVKSNIGHLEGSSGLAGVVKTILALEKAVIPPNANFENLNPQIDADFFNLKFPTQCIPWPESLEGIRRASVNSFGFGGSNCHVILEAADGFLKTLGHRTASRILHNYLEQNDLPAHKALDRAGDQSTMAPVTKGAGVDGGLGNGAAINGRFVKRAKEESSSYSNGDDTNASACTIKGASNGRSQTDSKPRLLVLSAADEDGIKRQARDLKICLDGASQKYDHEDILQDICFTLNTRRTMLEWRSYSVLNSLAGITDIQDTLSVPVKKVSEGKEHLGLVFTGQGAQWSQMGYELLSWPPFRASLERTQNILTKLGCSWSVFDELAASGTTSRLQDPELSQATTTAIQVAMVDLLHFLNIKPSVVIGHSSGEIAAAYCAGLLCQESALQISYFRGLVASRLAKESRFNPWGMASVGLPSDEIASAVEELRTNSAHWSEAPVITVSCINCPTNSTVAGPLASVDAFVDHLSSKQIFARKLKVDVGYHSAQMDLVSSDYLSHLSNLRPGAARHGTRMVSSVTPGLVGVDEACSADYWVENMTSTVRFNEAVGFCCRAVKDTPKIIDRSHLKDIYIDAVLEVGPHAALQGPLREIFKSRNRPDIFYTSLLARNKPADSTTLDAIGKLFSRGFDINLSTLSKAQDTTTRESHTIVDLPEYPFNHSVVHWEESSMSKAIRTRKHGHHTLLGSQLLNWNPLDARWGLTIKKDASPWVEDHQLHGSMWYPAAGIVVMAIEALKQLLPDDGFDFELNNVSFTAPVIVQENSSGTDVQISMIPNSQAQGSHEVHEMGYTFRVFAMRDDLSWSQVCDGTIYARRGNHAGLDAHKQVEEHHTMERLQAAYRHAVESCQESMSAGDMYRKIESSGLQYGPSFQKLTHVHYNKSGEAHAQLLHVEESVAENCRPYTIHPSTLDCIFQLAIPALTEGCRKTLPTFVPSRLTRLWISRQGAGNSTCIASPELVHVNAKYLSRRCAESSTTVFGTSTDHERMMVKVRVEELETTEYARNQTTENSEQGIRSVTHELVWKPDIALLDESRLYSYCAKDRGTGPEPVQWYEDVRRMLLAFVRDAFSEMQMLELRHLSSMDRYSAWLHARLNEYQAEPSNPGLPSGIELEKLANHYVSNGHRGALSVLVGRQLRQILTGEVDPLETIFADQSNVAGVYEEINQTGKAFPMLHAYLDALVHKYPGLRFFEVGAGTGTTTKMILDTIADPTQGPRYSQYMFTDISPYFFESAQNRLKLFDRVQYSVLNIEHQDFSVQDVVAQGEGSYDVVVAAQVLHATKDLEVTLTNVRRLLKPHGKLILVEMTTPQNVDTGFIWGALPGWWLGEEEMRHDSAVIAEDRWDFVLRQTGFNGTEQIFSDWDTPSCHGWSIMISSAMPPAACVEIGAEIRPDPPVRLGVFLVVDDSPSESQIQVAHCLMDEFKLYDNSTQTRVVTLGQLLTLPDDDINSWHSILLADVDRAHLHDLGSTTFRSYQRLLTTAKTLVWIQTRSGQLDAPPLFSLAEGLCRVVRSERPFAKIKTLVLESGSGDTELETRTMARKILKISKNSILGLHAGEWDLEEEEYMELSDLLCINRIRQAKYLDQHLASRIQNEVVVRKFGSSASLQLGIRVPGLLDTLEWSEDTSVYDSLLSDEVEIKVRAIGVNFKDCLVFLGRVNSDTVGLECSGVVTRVGRDVKSFRAGDNVALATFDAFRSLVRARERFVVAVPDSMALIDAGGVPVAFLTAYYSLRHVGRLQKSETVLIHAAAGGTGQAAVQIAQNIGAEVFATVGSDSKKMLLMERYGIPEDHILYSRDASFAEGIKRMTNGKGVDVVLNSLSGRLLVASWNSIAEFGRFVEIGRKDIDNRGSLPMFPFKRNAMFAGVDLAAFVDNGKASAFWDILPKVFDMMKAGILRPTFPIQHYPVDQAAHAFRSLVSGKTSGKLMLVTDDEAMVPVRTSDDSAYRFSNNATYVVAGGLGGIGRQITRWLVRRGATNILLLSRSGVESNPNRLKMVMDLEGQGIHLQCESCDITDLASVRQAVDSASKTMPPIRGCFQAAMVIQDRTFSAMSHDEWRASVSPKVQGSWNLHTVLPSGMDFFIMLSSTVSVFGSAGQANYAAGNTFLDALSRQRVANGEKSVALDLGVILDEGWVAERQFLQQRWRQFDHVIPISQRDLFAMLDYYCNPATMFDSPAASQIITGLELPALILKAGREIPAAMKKPLFSAMHQVLPGGELPSTAAAETGNIATMFEEAETLEQAGAAVAEALKMKLCKILGLDADSRTIQEQMSSFGVDSLIALELRNWIAKEMRADLAVYEILGDVRLIDTGLTAARKSEYKQAGWK